jgi:hypothetical protein
MNTPSATARGSRRDPEYRPRLPLFLGLVAFPVGSFALMLVVFAQGDVAIQWVGALFPLGAPVLTARVARNRGNSGWAAFALALGTVVVIGLLTVIWIAASVAVSK